MKVSLKGRKTLYDVLFLTDEEIYAVNKKNNLKRVFEYSQVKFTFDAEWEEELIKNREILAIKKPRCASFYMHYAILMAIKEHIKEHIKEEIKSIAIIEDGDGTFKKGFLKDIKCIVNLRGIRINISGNAYKNIFDIKISDLDDKNMLESISYEYKRVKQKIENESRKLMKLDYILKNIPAIV
ncbi:hypothetical protein [Caloramator mitchellensis]|uniref:hypothetical protein n=1 Tax=Caloramator mitchellensis TaxID=908809 RepID=UPI0007172EFC|nr:hypothetical protein [Caloramator mitchellensis]